jgi:hypothetical protein
MHSFGFVDLMCDPAYNNIHVLCDPPPGITVMEVRLLGHEVLDHGA